MRPVTTLLALTFAAGFGGFVATACQAALDAPRWKVNAGRSIDLEASASAELRQGLIGLGHKMESVPDSYMDFGAGQFIVRTDDGYVAASDSRRDGQAAGF